jgi:membrane dipeptidase
MSTFAPLDLHVDSIIQNRLFWYDITKKHRSGFSGQPLFWHADIPRMLEAGYHGACLGIHYFPWQSEAGWRAINRQLDYLDEVAKSDDRVRRVWRPETWADIEETSDQLAIAPGVEGAHVLNGRVDRIDTLAERGVSYLTLTHFSKNRAATPSMGRGANSQDGITEFGRQVIERLNEVGVAVDLAHVNTPGVLEACQITDAPVLCTHTGVAGVHNHDRNITDAEIDAIAETGGVIGIIFAPAYLTGKLRASTECVLDHIDYVADRAGVEHVAIGSDYDGWIPSIPSDQRDCRDIEKVYEGLRHRGYGPAKIDKIARRNVERVLENVGANRSRQPNP